MSTTSERADRFAWPPEAFPQCLFCRHLAKGQALACAAFPARIPDEILQNRSDHRRPWLDPETGKPGDEGIALAGSITFTPRDGVPAHALDRLYARLDRRRTRIT